MARQCGALRRSRAPAALVAVLLAAAVLCRLAAFAAWRPGSSPQGGGQSRPRMVSPLAAGSGEAEAWRDAYNLELERNALLRDQLAGVGEEAEAPEKPDESDWGASYERIGASNKALEERLRALQAEERESSAPKVAVSAKPQRFEVEMPENKVTETVELTPYFGSSAFYSLRLQLPLGLKLTKCQEAGPTMGAFVVEEVLPDGAGAASRAVLAGDILQSLSVVVDGMDMGMKTEDFVSSVVGGFGRYRQQMTEATYVNTVDELVELIRSNTLFGGDAKLTLIFERDASVSPTVSKPLQPLSS